jgi:hypothetical protein
MECRICKPQWLDHGYVYNSASRGLCNACLEGARNIINLMDEFEREEGSGITRKSSEASSIYFHVSSCRLICFFCAFDNFHV